MQQEQMAQQQMDGMKGGEYGDDQFSQQQQQMEMYQNMQQ